MASINIIGSGLMAILSRLALSHLHLTGDFQAQHYPKTQYSLINAKRAHWLQSRKLWCSSSSPVYRIRLIAEQQHCLISHPTPLGYLINHDAWMQQLLPSIRTYPTSQDNDFKIIASGASPNLILPPRITTDTHNYGQHATLTHIRHEKDHHQTATQLFDSKRITGALPLSSPYESILISSIPSSTDGEYFTLPEPLTTLLGSYDILNHSSPKALHSTFRYPAYADNTLLLGDSRLQLHPLAGMGLNAGLYALEDLYHQFSGTEQLDQCAYIHTLGTQRHLNRLHLLTRVIAQTMNNTPSRTLLKYAFSLLETTKGLKTSIKIFADP